MLGERRLAFSVLRGSQSRALLAQSDEKVVIDEMVFGKDRADRKISGRKLLHASLKAQVEQALHRGHAPGLFVEACEVVLADVDVGGEVIEREVALVVLHEVAFRKQRRLGLLGRTVVACRAVEIDEDLIDESGDLRLVHDGRRHQSVNFLNAVDEFVYPEPPCHRAEALCEHFAKLSGLLTPEVEIVVLPRGFIVVLQNVQRVLIEKQDVALGHVVGSTALRKLPTPLYGNADAVGVVAVALQSVALLHFEQARAQNRVQQ